MGKGEFGRRFVAATKIAVGMAVSALFLWLALRNVDVERSWRSLVRMDPVFWIGAMVLTVINHTLRTWRWAGLLDYGGAIRFRSLFSSVMISNFANNVLPLRLGELARAYSLKRRDDVPIATSLVSIVVERLFDVLSVVVLLGLLVWVTPQRTWVSRAAWSMLIVALLGMVALVVAYRFKEMLARKAEQSKGEGDGLLRRVRRIVVVSLHRAAEGAGGLKSVGALVKHSWSTMLVLVSGIIATTVCLMGYPRPGSISGIEAAIAVHGFVSIAAIVPAAPANVGPIQYATVIALTPFGYLAEDALAFSLVYHASMFIPLTAIGLIYFLQASLNLKDIAGSQEME